MAEQETTLAIERRISTICSARFCGSTWIMLRFLPRFLRWVSATPGGFHSIAPAASCMPPMWVKEQLKEIDIVTMGGNYGWRVFEGTVCTNLGPAPCS